MSQATFDFITETLRPIEPTVTPYPRADYVLGSRFVWCGSGWEVSMSRTIEGDTYSRYAHYSLGYSYSALSASPDDMKKICLLLGWWKIQDADPVITSLDETTAQDAYQKAMRTSVRTDPKTIPDGESE